MTFIQSSIWGADIYSNPQKDAKVSCQHSSDVESYFPIFLLSFLALYQQMDDQTSNSEETARNREAIDAVAPELAVSALANG